jgi:hypothetical protein
MILVIAIVALAGYYGFKFGNKWDLVPSNTVEAVIDSIYGEKKMVLLCSKRFFFEKNSSKNEESRVYGIL